MAVTNPLKKYQGIDLLNITNKLNDNNDLASRFIDDVIRITGFEIDEEGYVVDAEDDPIEPEYIVIRGRVLRHTNKGILHNKDLIFDPYNNPMIMEELFRRYLETTHPDVVSHQLFPLNPNNKEKVNAYGYITVMYYNGAKIKSGLHYKDSTKYLDAYMRMESMTDAMINDTLKIYDDFEKEWFTNPDNLKVNQIK
jgi:hypothetical protein